MNPRVKVHSLRGEGLESRGAGERVAIGRHRVIALVVSEHQEDVRLAAAFSAALRTTTSVVLGEEGATCPKQDRGKENAG